MVDEPTPNETNDSGTEPTKESLVSAAKTENQEGDSPGKEAEQADKADSQADDKGQKDGAPDQYDAFAMPDGIEVDAPLMEEFTGIAKELNLTQDQAQKFVDIQTREMQKLQQAQLDNWNSVREEWVNASKNDQEFGGKAFEENLGVMVKAIDAFGGESFREVLDDTGMGDHPEMLRFLFKVGQAVGEDRIHIGGGVHGERDVAKGLYNQSDHN